VAGFDGFFGQICHWPTSGWSDLRGHTACRRCERVREEWHAIRAYQPHHWISWLGVGQPPHLSLSWDVFTFHHTVSEGCNSIQLQSCCHMISHLNNIVAKFTKEVQRKGLVPSLGVAHFIPREKGQGRRPVLDLCQPEKEANIFITSVPRKTRANNHLPWQLRH